MAKFTPMLAASAEFDEVKLPALMSPKIDGFRCSIWGGKALTRSCKPMPNNFVREYLSGRTGLEGLDGELVVGLPDDPSVFLKSSGELRRTDGSPDFTFWVFDYRTAVDDDVPFQQRLQAAETLCAYANDPRIRILPHVMVNTREEQEAFEAWCLERGYEGAMARDPQGRYKNGRSTLRENILVKRKTFVDGEAEIVGFYELMVNNNEAFIDETGKQKRSTDAAGLVPGNTLGGFKCKEVGTGVEFNLGGGSGFDAESRKMYWDMLQENPLALQGHLAKFKHFPYGRLDKPRIATFEGLRPKWDVEGPDSAF